MALTLYYSPASAPSRTVLLTLMNLGVEFERKKINMMAGEHKTEEFTSINRQQTIPVVVDDDFVMTESRAICGYLVDAKSPNNTLYPLDDVRARFIIDHRLYYDATTFTPALIAAIVPILRRGETVITQERKDKIYSVINTLESFLDDFEWFSASENVSIADLAILASFSTLYHVGLDITNYPNIAAWYERCSSLPGFAENENGAKMFASLINSKLTEPF